MSSFFDFVPLQGLGSLRSGFFPLFALQKITQLAIEGAAQFVQDIGTIHSRAIVIEPQQCGIANTRFLPQAVQRPSLLLKDCREPGNDHDGNVTGSEFICQATYTCILYFTQRNCWSKLATVLERKSNPEVAVKGSGVGRHAS